MTQCDILAQGQHERHIVAWTEGHLAGLSEVKSFTVNAGRELDSFIQSMTSISAYPGGFVWDFSAPLEFKYTGPCFQQDSHSVLNRGRQQFMGELLDFHKCPLLDVSRLSPCYPLPNAVCSHYLPSFSIPVSRDRSISRDIIPNRVRSLCIPVR